MEVDTWIKYRYITDIVEIYLSLIVNVIGTFLNLINVCVYCIILKRTKPERHMIRYLLAKSGCDLLITFLTCFNPFLIWDPTLEYKFFRNVWSLFIYEYTSRALMLTSSFFEVAATFDCAISIQNKMKWCAKRTSFYVTLVIVIVVSFLFMAYIPVFEKIYKLKKVNNLNQTITIYISYYTEFIFDHPYIISIYLKVESYLRGLILLLILVAINIYILFIMFKVRKRKEMLTSNSRNIGINPLISSAEKAERRKIKMIIFLLFLYFFGNFLTFILYFISDNTLYYFCFIFADLFIYLAYALPFVGYFLFNTNFKLIVREYLNIFINIFRRNVN
jgi:hypothetical protein